MAKSFEGPGGNNFQNTAQLIKDGGWGDIEDFVDTIDDEAEREQVVEVLTETGKEIIAITEAQKHRFAGNMLQVMGEKPYLVMSNSAYNCLTVQQKAAIEKHCPILHSSLDTIEACGGGSARCMMAEVFLPKQKQ